jgi:hypothetical protein
VGRIRKKYRVKRGRIASKAKKALEEWRRSFTIEGKGRILLFNFRQFHTIRSTIPIT